MYLKNIPSSFWNIISCKKELQSVYRMCNYLLQKWKHCFPCLQDQIKSGCTQLLPPLCFSSLSSLLSRHLQSLRLLCSLQTLLFFLLTNACTVRSLSLVLLCPPSTQWIPSYLWRPSSDACSPQVHSPPPIGVNLCLSTGFPMILPYSRQLLSCIVIVWLYVCLPPFQGKVLSWTQVPFFWIYISLLQIFSSLCFWTEVELKGRCCPK